jgi:DNA-binding MarR family transcriptional regulator
MTDSAEPAIDDVRGMLRELTVTTSMLHAQADRALSGVGQNLSRWQALHHYASAPTTVPNVARALNQSRQYVQRITDEMTAQGLVEATVNPGHRRSPFFVATPRGVEMLGKLEDSVAEWTGYLAGALPQSELAALRSTLGHLRQMVDDYSDSERRGPQT